MRGLAAVLGAAALVAVLSTTGSAAPAATVVTTFTLTKSEVTSNPNANELTIDAAGQKASQHHCCDGGKWDIEYFWKVPTSFTTTSATFPATLGISSMTAVPVQPLLIQTTIRFPDFAQPFQLHYPDQMSGSRDFQIPIGAYLKGWKEPVKIIVGVVSAEVTYTYTPSTTSTGATTTTNEPAPGRTAIVTSPNNLPSECHNAYRTGVDAGCGVKTTLTDSGGDLNGTTIVGAGERTKAQATGEAVAACWLIGPDALTITDDWLKRELQNDDPDGFAHQFEIANAKQKLILCLILATLVAQQNQTHNYQATTAPAAACHAQRFAVRARLKKGKLVGLGLVKQPVTATSIRYSCSAGNGSETITADGRVRGGLQRTLGPKLLYGVMRLKNAPKRSAQLRFTYDF